jgi:hypothetical protein
VIEASCDLVNWYPMATNFSPNPIRPLLLDAFEDAKFYRARTGP